MVFFHKQELQYKSTSDKPDAVYARKLQEDRSNHSTELRQVFAVDAQQTSARHARHGLQDEALKAAPGGKPEAPGESNLRCPPVAPRNLVAERP